MNIRMALLERAAAAGLPAEQLRTLLGAAALDEPPAGLAARTARGLAVAAGALCLTQSACAVATPVPPAVGAATPSAGSAPPVQAGEANAVKSPAIMAAATRPVTRAGTRMCLRI